MMIPTVGVVGIHSFAKAHLEALLALQREGVLRVAAAVAHQRELDPAGAAALEAQGVALVADLDALLALPRLDLVTLPVGIPLHAPFACRVLASGRACFLEKPVAGTLADADAIADAARAAGRPVFVGFQDLFHPAHRALKARLAAGGRIRRITVTASWPRDLDYYERNAWAGRLSVDGAAVNDSPANNACAHYLMLALFLAGSGPEACARPRSVAGRLWRAHPIESFDSCSLRFATDAGADIVFNVSHAAARPFGPLMRVETDAGAAEADLAHEQPAWRLPDGGSIPCRPEVLQRFRHAVAALRGERAPVCTLAQARTHVEAVELAHRQLAIAGFPGHLLRRSGRATVVDGLDAALLQAHAGGALVGDWWQAKAGARA